MHWDSPELIITVLLGWSGVLLGAVRYFFSRELKQLDARLEQVERHERRIAAIEAQAHSRPNCNQHVEQTVTFRTLSSRMDELHGSITRQEGQLIGISRAVDLMNEYLINRAK